MPPADFNEIASADFFKEDTEKMLSRDLVDRPDGALELSDEPAVFFLRTFRRSDILLAPEGPTEVRRRSQEKDYPRGLITRPARHGISRLRTVGPAY